jgi:methylmalonyl-CoA/ethylmalonyl-CoA epimerase
MNRPDNAAPIDQVFQVCAVVNDLRRAMEQYWTVLGIGPWRIYTFQPPALTDMRIGGEPKPFSMKIALTEIGQVQWELVEPLDGPSIYKDFLREKGEGVHHVQFVGGTFDGCMAAFGSQGIQTLMTGTFHGRTFAYLDTEPQLGVIAEVVRKPSDRPLPAPEEVWPAPMAPG